MFQKNNIPWNKGKHIQTNTGKTHFKKGRKSEFKDKTYKEIYGKEKTKEIIKKQSNSHKWMTGENNAFYGKKHNKKTRQHWSEIRKRTHQSPYTEFKKGHKINLGRKRFDMIERNKDPNFLKKCRLALQIKPNRPEKRFIELIQKYNLPYRYTGDSSFWIGNVNPDFININGEKIAIEIWGNYWHNLEKEKLRDKKRLEILKEFGWERIEFWENELNNTNLILQKIKEVNADA